jgi:PKD repeat protein
MKRTLLLSLFILVNYAIYAQCSGVTFTPLKASYCAGEPVTINVKNPRPGTTYRMIINGVTYNDTTAIVGFPGAATSKDYFIDVQYSTPPFGFISCQGIPALRPKVTIDPSPDPTVLDISPNKSGIGDFRQCVNAQTYELVIQNGSATASTYTQTYTINWGDATTYGPSTTFGTLNHMYAQPGFYTMSVTVTANELSGACKTVTKSYNLYFGVLPNIGGIGSLNNSVLCAPDTQQYLIDTTITNRNPPGTSYFLSVGGSVVANYVQPIPRQINYVFTKTSCGEKCNGDDYFLVKITAKNLCGELSSSTCQPVAEKVEPVIVGKDTVCINQPTTYINNDPKSKLFVGGKCQTSMHTWNVIPNTGITGVSPALNIPKQINTLTLTFTQLGTYRITLHDSAHCNERDTFKDIVVVQPVQALAKYTSPPCIPASGFIDVPVTNLSTKRPSALGYTWSVTPSLGVTILPNANADSVTLRFTRSGSYNVHLVVDGACSDQVWDSTLLIKGKPAIDTLPIPQGCSVPHVLSNPAQYFNFSNGGDPAATYTWTFAGGTPASSTIRNPVDVTYASAGTFPVILKVSAVCGDSTLTNILTVNNNPKPNAGPDLGACKFDAPFLLNATPTGGIWRGQGITDSVTGKFSPISVPTGSYTIIYVLNPLGICPTYDTIKVSVFELVGLEAGPDQTVCKSTQPIKLTNDPRFPGGTWIGQGVTNGIQGIFDPVGLAPGFYQVGYVYSDSSGACSDTAYKRITVFDSIHISLPPPLLCAGQPFNFGLLISNVSNATWKFGDGTPDAIIPNPTHIYANAGSFVATLYAQSPDGCKDTIRVNITVTKNPPLKFLMTPDSTCTGLGVAFTFPPTHDTTNHYIWSFGVRPNIDENAPNSHIVDFPVPVLKDTNYVITLRADYYCGPAFYSDTLKVKAKPKADFGVQSVGCSPFQPILNNTSYGSATSFSWNFGNGQSSTLQNPVAPTYVNNTRRDTTYTIRLIASNSCGTDSIKKTITIKGNDVNARFFTNIDRGCQPLLVDFYNTSNPGSQIIWDFGDGTSAYADQVTHQYDSAGTFRVKLLAIGDCGRDSAFTTVIVYGSPIPKFEVRNPCINVGTQFINQSTNGNSFIWYFGDSATSISTQRDPIHVYATPGTYTVKLIVANSRPCVDSIEKDIAVSIQPDAQFSVVKANVCQDEPTVFLNQSVNGLNYVWQLGNGETSTNGSLTYTYPASGSYNVTLTAINGNCRDSLTKPAFIQIYPKPVADFLYDLGPQGFNVPINFTNTTFGGSTYFWDFGDRDTSILTDPSHQYFGEGPYRVTLYVVSDKGCKDTVNHPIGVDYTGQLYVPNVFSPETGLGEAAIWRPKGLSMKEYHVEVFSTYGQLLWESSALENGQPTEGWDGRWKGTLLPQDIYVWKIRAIFTDGKAWEGMKDPKSGKKAIMGSILLLR